MLIPKDNKCGGMYMKKIKEIMNDMNNISQQIATTISNELESEEILETTALATPSYVSTESTYANVDANSRNVPFCAVISLPNNFTPDLTTPGLRIIYDLSCLRAVVEPCCYNGISKWDIRIIGCISFIANINILNTPEKNENCVFPRPNTVASCGSNNVCLNRVICNKCNYETAVISRANLILNYDTVTVQNLYFSFNPEDCFAKVTGDFVLPDCP